MILPKNAVFSATKDAEEILLVQIAAASRNVLVTFYKQGGRYKPYVTELNSGIDPAGYSLQINPCSPMEPD